ncbi:serine/threonine-protein kinase [Kitasatospora sp. NPDC088779]|uniref:serine/threonine-protein kinase n=1 Tax=Kitasatospora sp. NPDC088779 TaxID=3154964 RepID=UPI0034184135
MQETRVVLGAKGWLIGRRIGDSGGFGEVFEATAEDGTSAAVKFIPQHREIAGRELLFADVKARNVVPVIDKGEVAEWQFSKGGPAAAWVIVMPLAETSLEAHLKVAGGTVPLAEAITILLDIALALSDLAEGVVHRDLKPANVLLLGGRWCLADFGLARYADATTGTMDTWKGAGTPWYQAPEVWNYDHQTVAIDVYSFGVIAFQLLSGNLPFLGPTREDLRRQHVHEAPPRLPGVPSILAALVAECLHKLPELRPTPAEVLDLLTRAGGPAVEGGRAALAAANLAEVTQRAEQGRLSVQWNAEAERREQILAVGEADLTRISEILLREIAHQAPAGTVQDLGQDGWIFTLGRATLAFSSARPAHDWVGTSPPPFDVIAYAAVTLQVPDFHPGPHPGFANPGGVGTYGYRGRSHSLWYCNARGGRYRWFETAFMTFPTINQHPRTEPYALRPDVGARRAFETTDLHQVAVPFRPLDATDLDAFVDRWATLLAAAYDGTLTFPRQLPESGADGSWK